MKKWVLLAVVAATAVAGGFLWRHRAHPVQLEPVAAHPSTAPVESRNIHFVLTAAGDITPADQVSVRAEINGRISQLPLDIGDSVKQGDLLVGLDDRDLQTERSSCMTEIDGAQLQVDKTRRYFERSTELYKSRLVSQEVYEDTRTDFEMATNSLEKSEKALRQVEDQLAKTRVNAPFDCTVLTRPVSVGQAVSGSGGVNGGTEVMTIANLKNMIVTAHVNQADVTHMKNGQSVNIDVEAVPGLTLKGVVQRIAPQATIKNNLKGFDAQILLTTLDDRVRPGMTANVSIPLVSADNVLAVPLAAVFTEEAGRYVYVSNADGFEQRPIQIGVADFQYAEILSGLSAGEMVSLVRPTNTIEIKASGVRGSATTTTNANRSELILRRVVL